MSSEGPAFFLYGAEECSCGEEAIGVFRRTWEDGRRDVIVKSIGGWSGEEPKKGTAYVPLAPAEARKVAAYLLNAADACDGTIPLVFMPASPDGQEPVR